MKNLKRALSLALSSVMLLGMMVVGTGAASYDDVKATDNVEAIEVLKTVGVMEGDEKGDFNPDAKVTRNEMAVIMSRLMDYRVANYAGTSPFTDVPSWAEPFVAACYTNGITTGTSATTYGGDDTVTTAQAALMLMKALGYFQYQSDFGSDWQLATTRQGARIDLFSGINAGVKEAMTRNDVAQLVLNTLRAGMVEPDSDILNVTTGDVSVQAGKVNYYYVVSEKAYANALGTDASTGLNGQYESIVQLGEKLYGGNLDRDGGVTDAFGRPATKWSYKSTSIGTFAADPVKVYTAKASKDALYNLLGSSTVGDLTFQGTPLNGDEDKLVVYVDGAIQTGDTVADYFDRNNSNGGFSGNGVVTEVYLDNDGNVTLVYINTYLMQAINDYNEKKGTIDVATLTSPTAHMGNGNAYTPGTTFDVDDFAAIKDLKADDYILYTASFMDGSWGVANIAKAELTQGVVDAYSTGSWVKVAGTQLDYNKCIEGADLWDNVDNNTSGSAATTYVVTDTASLVLDKYGYVIFVDDASVSLGNYVFIQKTAQENSLSTTNIANAYFADGTNAVITLKEVKNSAGTVLTIPTGASSTLAGWYSYTKNSAGQYTLKKAATTTAAAGTSVAAIKTDKAGIAGVGLADKNTVFLIQETDGNKNLYIATGISNVPEIQNAQVWAMLAKDTAGKNLSLVYVEASKDDIKNALTKDMMYLLRHSYTYVDTTDGAPVYVWKVLVNGAETTVETKESWTAGNMYVNYRMDADGYYEDGDLFNGASSATDELVKETTGMYTIGDDTIVLSGNTLKLGATEYIVGDNTKVTLVLDNMAGGTQITEVMTDVSAKYEVTENVSSKTLAGLFKNYKVNANYYIVLEDDADETDVIKNMVVIVDDVR